LLKSEQIKFEKVQVEFEEGPKQKMTVTLEPNKIAFQDTQACFTSYGTVKIQRNANNIVTLQSLEASDTQYKLSFANNIQRDVFTLVARELIA